jgi:hypothetical protein
MRAEYDRICGKIDEARKAGDFKTVRRWRKKLEKWQLEYGAIAPIK